VPRLHPVPDSDVDLLSNPEDVRSVLQSDPSDFRALDVPGPRDSSCVVRNGIVSLHSERDEGSWIQRLRLVGPEFRAEAAERQVPEIAETTLATVGELSDGLPGHVSAGGPGTVPEPARVWAPHSEGCRRCAGSPIGCSASRFSALTSAPTRSTSPTPYPRWGAVQAPPAPPGH